MRALLTGATGGIGSELAFLLAEEGFSLTLVGRKEEALLALQKKISPKSSVNYFVADHSKKEEFSYLEKYIVKNPFDLLINNAGFGLYGEAIHLPLSLQQEMIDVNISALMRLTLIGAQSMIKEGRGGIIVNVSSLASFFPTPLMAVYGATKAFVTSFSEAVDYESSSQGVHVLAFCPGMVATSFAEKAAQGKALSSMKHQMTSRKAAEHLLKQIKRKKVLYLCDGKAKWAFYLGRLLPKKWQKRIIYKSLEKRI